MKSLNRCNPLPVSIQMEPSSKMENDFPANIPLCVTFRSFFALAIVAKVFRHRIARGLAVVAECSIGSSAVISSSCTG